MRKIFQIPKGISPISDVDIEKAKENFYQRITKSFGKVSLKTLRILALHNGRVWSLHVKVRQQISCLRDLLKMFLSIGINKAITLIAEAAQEEGLQMQVRILVNIQKIKNQAK